MTRVEKNCALTLLAITLVAAAVLAFPSFVIVGLFLFVLPGLILFCSVSIALYGWLLAIPYALLRILGIPQWSAVAIALLAPLSFGFGLPIPSNATTHANLAAATAGDIRPAQPLPIGGTVALISDNSFPKYKFDDNSCEELCLHLLYNNNAKIVYLANLGRPGATFTIERRKICPPFTKSNNQVLRSEWPETDKDQPRVALAPPPSLESVVRSRIAAGECLVRIEGSGRVDWTIKFTIFARERDGQQWSLAPASVQGERITVYRHDASGVRKVGRVTNAGVTPLWTPLVPSLVGYALDVSWGWGRNTAGRAPSPWDTVGALRSLIAFEVARPKATSPARVRELLAAALADPRRERDDAGLLLANQLMADIDRNGARSGDAALLSKAIADVRFADMEAGVRLGEKLGVDYVVVVDSAIERFARLPDENVGRLPYELSILIQQMPQSWFAKPPPSLKDLLRDPAAAARAEKLVARLDAGGAAAVPLLTEIIVSGAEWASFNDYRDFEYSEASKGINAAAAAICRIGAPARSALSSIVAAKESLLRLVRYRPDRDGFRASWRGRAVNDGFVVTLVSLGVPITEFEQPERQLGSMTGTWAGDIMSDVNDHRCTL